MLVSVCLYLFPLGRVHHPDPSLPRVAMHRTITTHSPTHAQDEDERRVQEAKRAKAAAEMAAQAEAGSLGGGVPQISITPAGARKGGLVIKTAGARKGW